MVPVALSACICMGGIVSASGDTIKKSSVNSVSFAEKVKNSASKYKDVIKNFFTKRREELIPIGGVAALATVGFSSYKLGESSKQKEKEEAEAEERAARSKLVEANEQGELLTSYLKFALENIQVLLEQLDNLTKEQDELKRQLAEKSECEGNGEEVKGLRQQVSELTVEKQKLEQQLEATHEWIDRLEEQKANAEVEYQNLQTAVQAGDPNAKDIPARCVLELKKRVQRLTTLVDKLQGRGVVVKRGILRFDEETFYFHKAQEDFLRELSFSEVEGWNGVYAATFKRKYGNIRNFTADRIKEIYKEIFLEQFNALPKKNRYGLSVEVASAFFDKFIVPHCPKQPSLQQQ